MTFNRLKWKDYGSGYSQTIPHKFVIIPRHPVENPSECLDREITHYILRETDPPDGSDSRDFKCKTEQEARDKAQELALDAQNSRNKG